ncbi:hypothetical protein HHL17_25235 [Chitinophaga sp. G-6-1-13]|uniref:Secretin/TonB short N-terminal domain-containing protein n=1 Tax=Chitinophaga fulva TaxID=2728842 RepID=A0A848GPJ1_9BACT|nr:hypothetical protein [Chitinophaga fulva]NML40525.1 hypothetical protein [Chitinophaga fulva]
MSHAELKKTKFLSAAPAVVGRWLLTIFLFTGAVQGYSQSSAVDLRKNITIPAGEMPLDKLLNAVGQQTGARFSLNTRKFPPSRLIHIHKKIQPLGVLLEDIQQQTGISYRLLGGHVIFVDAPPVRQAVPVVAPSKPAAAVKQQATSRKTAATSRNNKQAADQTGNNPATAALPQVPVLKVDSVVAHQPSPDSVIIRPDTLKTAIAAKRKDSLLQRQDSGLLNLSLRKSPEGQKEKNRWGIGNIGFPGKGEGIFPPLDTSTKKEAAPPLTAEAIRKQPAATNPQQKTTTASEATATQHAGITANNTRNKGIGNKREHSFFLTNWFRRSNSSFTGIRNSSDGPRPGLIPFVSAGVTLEESFIINGHLQAGMPFLYGIASWGTGGGASGLRYGAGTSVRLGEDWRIHFQGTTGRMQFDYDSSIFVQKQIRMQWHKLALIGERRLNDHFGVQGGISLNILNSEYYTFNEPTPLGRREEEALKDVRYFKPLYTISDNFSTSEPQNRKMWIGIQLGVFYRLDFRRK